MSSKFVKN
jgi:hypothetical protein